MTNGRVVVRDRDDTPSDGGCVHTGGSGDGNASPGGRGCGAAVVLGGGVVLVVLTASLWNSDMPTPLRVALVVMAGSALLLGLAGLLGARR